jgi:hypothetical protein
MNKLSIGALVGGWAMFLRRSLFGQEPELPLTWEGKGEATFIDSGGEQEIEFDLSSNRQRRVVSGHRRRPGPDRTFLLRR